MDRQAKNEIRNKISKQHLRTKLMWLMDRFEPYFGKVSQAKIQELVDVYQNPKSWEHYLSVFCINGEYGYSAYFRPNNDPKVNTEVRVSFFAGKEDLQKVEYGKFILCLDLDVALISCPLLQEEDSLDYWYRSAIVDISMPIVLEIEE